MTQVTATLDTLIAIVSERIASLHAQGETEEYFKARVGLAFLLGLRGRLAGDQPDAL